MPLPEKRKPHRDIPDLRAARIGALVVAAAISDAQITFSGRPIPAPRSMSTSKTARATVPSTRRWWTSSARQLGVHDFLV